MELLSGLKQAESTSSITSDRVSALKGKLEDLLFRAQRIAAAQKAKMPVMDTMFGYDLQNFRREVRTFSHEVGALPNLIGGLERTAEFSEPAIRLAQSVMRIADRLSKSLRSIHDLACLAHSHIRASDHKIEAWYLVQEVEEMAQKGQTMPTAANKIVIKVSTPPAGVAPSPPRGRLRAESPSMLDFLLRYVTGRNLLIAVMTAVAMPFIVQLARFGHDTYMRAVYPPVRDNGGAASDIKAVLDQREREKVQLQYRRVSALVSDAKAMGYDVGALDWKLQSAMALDASGQRATALQLLSEVEMAAPRKKVQYIPLYAPAPRDTMTDEDEAPATPAAVVSPKTKKPAKKAAPKAKRKTRRHA